MSVQSLKKTPFLEEVESLLSNLGLRVDLARNELSTSVMFKFDFNDVPVYVCVPTLETYSSITRIEAEVAELDEVEGGQLIVAIASYLQIEDCTPLRVTNRRSKGRKMKILLEFVSDLQLLQTGALATMLLHCCELADQMRRELVSQEKSSVA